MVAIRGEGSPHFGFAGHLDVVPAGDGWPANPFAARIDDGMLVGRGANDMKSAIAAFVAAISAIDHKRGTLSLLITGDEEGYATFGTPRIIDWLKSGQIRPDMILIGEPTSVDPGSATRSRSGGAARSTCGSRCPACRVTSPTPTAPTNPVPPLAADHRRTGSAPPRRRHRRLSAVEPRIHRARRPRRTRATSSRAARRAAQHPLQQSPQGRRSRAAWSRRWQRARRRARPFARESRAKRS